MPRLSDDRNDIYHLSVARKGDSVIAHLELLLVGLGSFVVGHLPLRLEVLLAHRTNKHRRRFFLHLRFPSSPEQSHIIQRKQQIDAVRQVLSYAGKRHAPNSDNRIVTSKIVLVGWRRRREQDTKEEERKGNTTGRVGITRSVTTTAVPCSLNDAFGIFISVRFAQHVNTQAAYIDISCTAKSLLVSESMYASRK